MSEQFIRVQRAVHDESDEQFIREKEMSEPDDSDLQWSIEGSPPVADDARREQPADQVQQQQGGCSEAKPLLPEASPWVGKEFICGTCIPAEGNATSACSRPDCGCASVPTYLLESLARAFGKFDYFYEPKPSPLSFA